MNHVELNLLFDRFYTCQMRKGYIRVIVDGKPLVVQIAQITNASGRSSDRIVKTSTKDINGNTVPMHSFKLSDLGTIDSTIEVPLVIVGSAVKG